MKVDPVRQAILNKLRYNPLSFGKLIMPQMFTKPSPPFHKQMISEYLKPNVKLINIQAPRGHAKSSIMAGVVPLHHLMFDPTPNKFVVLVSKTQKHAKRLLQTIKDTLNYSEGLKQLFGYYGMHSAQKWTEEEIQLKDGSLITCVGTGQQVRGLKNVHQRPTLIILDDPEDENNTKTAESMSANLDWLLKGLVPSADSDTGKIIVIGTPLHQLCMVERLRDYSRWKSLHFSAEESQSKKRPLWPEKHSWEELQAIRHDYEQNNRLSVYYQEYLCTVIPDEDRLFKPEYFRYYTLIKLDHSSNPKNPTITYQPCDKKGNPYLKPITTTCQIYTGIDPATSTRDGADYTVILPIAVTPDDKRLVLPYIRSRMAPSTTIESIVKHHKKYKPIRTSIEATGAQETFRDLLRRRQDVHITGLAVKHMPRESKYKRHLDVLEPYFRDSLVLIQPTMSALYEEAITHPKGKHDDILDALYYAMLYAKAPKTKKTNHTNQPTHHKKPNPNPFMTA